jgi:hypothetical protein
MFIQSTVYLSPAIFCILRKNIFALIFIHNSINLILILPFPPNKDDNRYIF